MNPKLDTQTIINIFNSREQKFEVIREHWFKDTNLSNPTREIIVYLPLELRRFVSYIQEHLPPFYRIESYRDDVASDFMWHLIESNLGAHKIKECAEGKSHVVTTYQLDLYTAIIDYVHLIIHGVLHVGAEAYDIYKPTITVGKDDGGHILTDGDSIRKTIYIPVGVDKSYSAMLLDTTDASYEQWPMDKMLYDLIYAIKDGPEHLCPLHDYDLWHNEEKRNEADWEIRDITLWLFTTYCIEPDDIAGLSFLRNKLTIEPNDK